MGSSNAPDLNRLNELLTRGLTPDAADGADAWAEARTMMLQHGLTVSALTGGERTPSRDDSWAFEYKMPFGKYRDESLGWIAENDMNYLEWLEGKADIQSERLRQAIHIVYTENIPE